jgi:Mg2+/Co2+ transporter CorB
MLLHLLILGLPLLLILLAASLFSALETATVAVSNFRLQILSQRYFWAKCACSLKGRLNQVLIFSLFGNSLFNAIFTTISTLIVLQTLMHYMHIHRSLLVGITTFVIAVIIIICSEALPKVIAAKAPTATIRLLAVPMYYGFFIMLPVVVVIDKMIGVITYILRIYDIDIISFEELKAIIRDDKSPFKDKHRTIMLNSIDLEDVYVRDILIPIRLIEAVNLYASVDDIYSQIRTTHHTRIIVFKGNIDNILGFIHVKDMLALDSGTFTHEALTERIRPITFINDFMPLIRQIHRAQKQRNRIFVVINEYGDIVGIVCLEDMLQVVFGEFTTKSPQQQKLAITTSNNEIIVDGTMLVRDLNRLYGLKISYGGDVTTVNGLIIKTLNSIPDVGVCIKIDGMIFEVISVGLYWAERIRISL